MNAKRILGKVKNIVKHPADVLIKWRCWISWFTLLHVFEKSRKLTAPEKGLLKTLAMFCPSIKHFIIFNNLCAELRLWDYMGGQTVPDILKRHGLALSSAGCFIITVSPEWFRILRSFYPFIKSGFTWHSSLDLITA